MDPRSVYEPGINNERIPQQGFLHDTPRTGGGSSQVSGFISRWLYNHRKYFLAGYIVLFLSILPVNDDIAVICFFTIVVSIFLFVKGFVLRNVLLSYERNFSRSDEGFRPGEAGSSVSSSQSGAQLAPRKAVIVDGDTEVDPTFGELDDSTVWEVEETDYYSTQVAFNGVTVDRSVSPGFPLNKGKSWNLLGMEIERYMALFLLANIFFFGSYLGVRVWSDAFCLLILISIVIFIVAIIDKKMNGKSLYPIYLAMVEDGQLYDPRFDRIVPAEQWYQRYRFRDGEHVLRKDVLMLHNWKPHTFILTNRGIYLEERKGLVAGRSIFKTIFWPRFYSPRFIYIPLLSLKGLKLSSERINRSMLFSVFLTLFWSIFFPPLIIIAVLEIIYAVYKSGTQIKGKALNFSFALSRQKDKKLLMESRMLEMDHFYHQRMKEPDAQSEFRQYSAMDQFPPCLGLKELKRSVRHASTGIILPVFFYSLMKLMDILDVDTSGFMVFVLLVMVFALYRIAVAIMNAWNYQRYVEIPENGNINLGIVRLSYAELLIIIGYILISIGILYAILEDMLPLAYGPSIIGGLLILGGRYFYNSTFKGIDYEERVKYEPHGEMKPFNRFFVTHKRMILPTTSFIILLVLMSVSIPYFGQSRAEITDDFLDHGTGNNWERLPDEDKDIVGLMGMFSLSIRIYEDDAEDGEGYPAVLSVVTFKFPVTPDEKDMLEEMKKHLKDFSDDERVTLEEPPSQGEQINTQGFTYVYFIYNGTSENRTSRFTRGNEMRIIAIAFKVDEEKSFVIAVGIAQISIGRVVDFDPPPPLPPIPNPTDTRNFHNWEEMRDDLIPNIRI